MVSKERLRIAAHRRYLEHSGTNFATPVANEAVLDKS